MPGTAGTGADNGRVGYVLEFDEAFTRPELDSARWVAHYLPQWTTPDRSAARYTIERGILQLRIDADQPAWRLEDGELRVSNLQTGTFAGPLGSSVGQHRHTAELTVVTPVPARRLYTPTFGLIEADLRASADPTCMLAFWSIGYEDDPASSGEICIAEIFGRAIDSRSATVNIGVKTHHDPRLHDDMEPVALAIDATAWHTYGAEWTPEQVRFFVDDELVRTVRQRIAYPMQLMVDLFEFPADTTRDPRNYPKIGEVKGVRGYRKA